MKKRKRKILKKVFYSEEEIEIVYKKMQELGTDNYSAFCRKMTIDGYVIKPKLYGNTFGVPAVWILIMIIVGGRIFGFWGIMLAIPATAVFAYIFETFISDMIARKNEMKETKKKIEKY